MKNQFKPRHLDVYPIWLKRRYELLADESVAEAIESLQAHWEEIARSKFDDLVAVDPEQARAEYDLDLHTGEVMVKDLFWLQETFEGIDLGDLALAIAGVVHPEKEWLLLEHDEDAVVTDKERSLVIDLKYGRDLSAEGSLLLVGDKELEPSRAALEEIVRWRTARLEKLNRSLDELKEMVRLSDETNQGGTVLPFPVTD